jgi:glycosyltransferase involved in cell wall biosynthesis
MYSLPKISVITPSYNQAEFLERTILSVINQGYPNLEFIIIDGGSTDGSVEIIKKYEDRLAFWISEPDDGQTEAINKGLKRATGEWLCWQNSDDIFYQEAFVNLASAAKKYPNADLIIGDTMLIDKYDNPLRDIRFVKPTYHSALAEGMILTNQSAFWKNTIHEKIGYLSETLHYGFDYEWFLRLLKHYRAAHTDHILGGLRIYGQTKTSLNPEKFEQEYATFLPKKPVSNLSKNYFRLRRLFLMLLNGRVDYVSRGILRYLRKQRGGLY